MKRKLKFVVVVQLALFTVALPALTTPAGADPAPVPGDGATSVSLPPPDIPPTPRREVVARSTNPCGVPEVMRHGYFQRDPVTGKDKGYGWEKMFQKHGVYNTKAWRFLVASMCPEYDPNAPGITYIYENTAYLMTCDPFGCYPVDSTVVRAVQQYEFDNKGMITLYCPNPDLEELCPAWLNGDDWTRSAPGRGKYVTFSPSSSR